MLEFLIMIGVMVRFAAIANLEGRSGLLWGCLAGIGYYVPARIFGQFIFPAIVKGNVTLENQSMYMALGIALSIAIGIGGCLLTRKLLLSIGNVQT